MRIIKLRMKACLLVSPSLSCNRFLWGRARLAEEVRGSEFLTLGRLAIPSRMLYLRHGLLY